MALHSSQSEVEGMTKVAQQLILTILREFYSFTATTPNREVNPLVFFTVAGCPDEAPKNQQALAVWARQFENHNLDDVFIFTHALGSSTYNPAERRMAPLSKDTAGIILPFDTFGNYLDAANKTIDVNLEIKNFEATGKIPAEI